MSASATSVGALPRPLVREAGVSATVRNAPMQACPLVSVVIPVRDGRATLARALLSIARQDYAPIETIIIDDASAEPIADIVAEFSHLRPILKRLETQHGAAAARNVALSYASGEFVAFLDADDEWLPGKMSRQVKTLTENPTLAFSHTTVFDSKPHGPDQVLTEVAGVRAHGDDAWKTLLKHGCVVTSSVMVRRALLSEAGHFAPRLVIAEDQDLWIRLALKGGVHHEPVAFARKYRRDESLSVVHRRDMATITLPMIQAHVAALAPRLKEGEVSDILAYRRLVAGRNCYESGQLVQGMMLVMSATWRGGGIARNLLYLLSASPPARALKRRFGWIPWGERGRLPTPPPAA